jgi:hypothetical protein
MGAASYPGGLSRVKRQPPPPQARLAQRGVAAPVALEDRLGSDERHRVGAHAVVEPIYH